MRLLTLSGQLSAPCGRDGAPCIAPTVRQSVGVARPLRLERHTPEDEAESGRTQLHLRRPGGETFPQYTPPCMSRRRDAGGVLYRQRVEPSSSHPSPVYPGLFNFCEIMEQMKSFWNDLPQPFSILAPMEAVTDVVFRHVVAAAAPPDIYFTEFTNATGWAHAGEKAIGGRLVKTDDEHPMVAQIWGGEPGDMEKLALHCRDLGYNGIDINMGCPAKSAVKSGGSALIRQPELAAEAIAAAKIAGLPVSVKTRLGYTRVDEWRDWLAHLLRQDIVNLTIHLRTKKEMSKVPAHHELIAEIVALRDEIAPETLLVINGDIETRTHGEALITENPGVNGYMIGRGVFHDPYCFAKQERAALSPETSAAGTSPDDKSREVPREAVSDESGCEIPQTVLPNPKRKEELLDLLRLHLDLFDQYQSQMHRPFETLKRFFKIYIRDFDGASALRDTLMHTRSTDEVREILNTLD